MRQKFFIYLASTCVVSIIVDDYPLIVHEKLAIYNLGPPQTDARQTLKTNRVHLDTTIGGKTLNRVTE